MSIGLGAEKTAAIINEHQSAKGDTGSPEVQVALLSERISTLTEHFKIHRKDMHSRRGLISLVNKRRKLLRYLKSRSVDRYRAIIAKLGLREQK